MAVLRELEIANHPLSHGEMAERLQGEGFDRATVYRNLIDLTESGLAQRHDHGDHVWRFELVSHTRNNTASHPHFICNSCGDVVCLPSSVVQMRLTRGAPRALRRGPIEVQLRGACDKCL